MYELGESGNLMETYINDSSTLRDYFKIIFRHKIVFLILPIAIIIPVFFSFELKMPMNQATVKMYVKGRYDAGTVASYKPLGIESPAEQHTELVNSNVVIERVVKALKLYQIPLDYEQRYAPRFRAALMKPGIDRLRQKLLEMPPEQRQDALFQIAMRRLSANVSAQPEANNNFFTISVQDVNPELAVVLANSVSRSYLIFDIEQQIEEMKLKYGEKHTKIIQLQDYIKQLETTLDGKLIPDLEALGPASIKVVMQAQTGEPVEGPNRTLILVLSFIISMFLSVILSFIFHYADHSFRTPQDIENYLNISCLGSIPRIKSKDKLLTGHDNPHADNYMRSYDNLCNQILLLMKDKNIKSLLITDAEGSHDSAFIVINIGTYIAQRISNKVLIIDADLRKSSVSKILDVSDMQGLSEVIDKRMLFEDAVHNFGPNLFVLPAGGAAQNPVAVLGSSTMSDLIKVAEENYDLVLINSVGIKNLIDSVILSSITNSFAIVINEGHIRRQVIIEAMAPLKQRNVNIVGAILNNRRYVIPDILYKLV